jgi:hypothetical protein
MTQNRFYSSATKRTTTTVDPGTSGTTLTVADTTSFASLDGSPPYTLLINWGLTDQEVVNVTARPSSTAFTVVRGQDGSSGLAHAIGATVDHGVSARDFTEAGAHVGASSGVHGLTGAVVGTSDVQTLTGKTIGDDLNVNGNFDVAGNALGVATPHSHGLVAWAFDPALAGTATAVGAGIVNMSALYIQKSASVTQIYWGTGSTQGATPTAGQNFVGLYNSAGTRLASVSADSNVSAATGIQTNTIPSTNLTPGMYWVAWVFNAATLPSLTRGVSFLQGVQNINLSAAQLRFANLGATTRTSLPTTITPASNAASQVSYWAGIG